MSSAATSSQVRRGSGGPEQLTLLVASSVSPRFQLSKDTRERGLRHIAEIRQLLLAGRDDRQQAA
jgi:hypothetical protein